MPAIVQIAPAGYLGLLQLKNHGAAPSPVADSLQPVIDLREWYQQTQARIVRGSLTGVNATATFSDFATPILVPENEWWFVSAYRLTVPLLATELCFARPSWRVGNSGSDIFGGPQSPDGTAPYFSATRGINAQFDIAAPWWVPPGSFIGFSIPDLSPVVSVSVFGRIRYTPMQV